MAKETYRFYASIGYANANREEDIEIEFDGTETEDEKEEIIKEEFELWLANFVDFSWCKK